MFETDARNFTLKLSPDILGIFEPVAATLFLNVSDETFDEWRANPDAESGAELTESFLHETYHCFQTYATGYCYAQCLAINSAMNNSSEVNSRYLKLIHSGIASALGDVVVQVFSSVLSQHARTVFKYSRGIRGMSGRLREISANGATDGETAVWGALNPGLHAARKAVESAMYSEGSQGLRPIDVIEGAAFIYGRCGEQVFGTSLSRCVDPKLEGEGPYQRLVRASLAEFPDCLVTTALSATAIALQYEQPHECYIDILRRLADTSEDRTLSIARDLAGRPAFVSSGGGLLGTAANVHQARGGKYRVYDRQFRRLAEEWSVDEFDILASTNGFHVIPPGELGYSLATRDSSRGGGSSGASMMVSSLLLPQGPSIARLKRDLQTALPY